MIGHHLVEVDRDGRITEEDWSEAMRRSALELTRKNFSDMYDFTGKGTLRETVLNILALGERPMTKKELSDHTAGKNIYTATCLGELKKSGAVKEQPDGTMALHSMLFRAAILIHLYTHVKTNETYRDLISRFGPSESSQALPAQKG